MVLSHELDPMRGVEEVVPESICGEKNVVLLVEEYVSTAVQVQIEETRPSVERLFEEYPLLRHRGLGRHHELRDRGSSVDTRPSSNSHRFRPPVLRGRRDVGRTKRGGRVV